MAELGPIHRAIVALHQRATKAIQEDKRNARTVEQRATEFLERVDRLASQGRHESVGTREHRKKTSFRVGTHGSAELEELTIDTDPKKGPQVIVTFQPTCGEPLRYQLRVESALGVTECAASFFWSGTEWLMTLPDSDDRWEVDADNIARAITGEG